MQAAQKGSPWPVSGEIFIPERILLNLEQNGYCDEAPKRPTSIFGTSAATYFPSTDH
jgi:hypothetical protein